MYIGRHTNGSQTKSGLYCVIFALTFFGFHLETGFFFFIIYFLFSTRDGRIRRRSHHFLSSFTNCMCVHRLIHIYFRAGIFRKGAVGKDFFLFSLKDYCVVDSIRFIYTNGSQIIIIIRKLIFSSLKKVFLFSNS